MDKVHIERLHRFKEGQREALAAFAASFGHEAPSMFPIDLAYVNGDLKGFYQITERAVIYPALHPEKTSPRDFYRLFHHLFASYRQRYGNPWMATEASYPEGGPTLEVFARLGIQPLNQTVYEVCP